MYTLYLLESPTNKKYIGVTSRSVDVRWNKGHGYHNNRSLYKDIKKYGWDNFKHEILFDNLTKEEGYLLEQMYIALYNTTNEKYGYNKYLGGNVHIPKSIWLNTEFIETTGGEPLPQDEYEKRKAQYFNNKK